MAAAHKFPWEEDLTEVMTSTVGTSEGDLSSTSLSTTPSSLQEELKLAQANLRECAVSARDQMQIFNEAATRFDKIFNSIPKKRSRSSELENSSASPNTTTSGGIGSTGIESQTGALEFEVPELEEKVNSNLPNKRTRACLGDPQIKARPNTLSMLHAPNGNDKKIAGLVGATQSEDKDLQISDSVDSCEKSRGKRKRTEINYEVPTSSTVNRLVEDDLESRRDTQQKLSSNIGSRRSTAQRFRSGISKSVAKSDVTSRNAGHRIGICSARKEDQDTGAHLHDRRDLIVASDKKRFPMKTSKRSSISPSSTTTTNSVARVLRSSSCTVPRASPSVHRSIGVNGDCELSQSSNKLCTVAGAKNPKHISQARSSSPPLAQWACPRSQKRTRAARRQILAPPAPGHDETPALDIDSNISSSDTVFRSNGRLPGNPPPQVISKTDHFCSAALSEREKYGASEMKFMDRSKISGEIDEITSQNTLNRETGVSLSRMNNLLGENLGLGGGVPKQGRRAVGSDNMTSGDIMSVEKQESAGTVKQLRSSTSSFNNNERHSPTRKLSEGRDRSLTRHSVNAEISDIQGDADDGHEELLGAATSSVNTGHACSGKNWKRMEATFGFVSSDDIAYIKQQRHKTPCEEEEENDHSITDGAENLIEQKRDCNVPSLFQRVMSAFILEEEEEEDSSFDVYGSETLEEVELKGDSLSQQLCVVDIPTPGKTTSNGYRIPTTEGYLADFKDDNIVEDTNPAPITGVACTQAQYDQMSIDERLRLELQSVGLFSDLPEDEVIMEEDIRRHQNQLQQQGSRGRNACHGKGKSAKIARQAASSFVKQTNERCKNFDNRKESCFNKPAYVDILHSVPSLVKIAEEGEETSDIPQSSSEVTDSSNVEKEGALCIETEVIDLSKLPLPDVDLLGGGEQDQDLPLRLGNDEECQDSDWNGLVIPMDNIDDLNLRI